MKTIWVEFALAFALALSVACGTSASDPVGSDCPGELLAFAGDDWCVVIEEGFLESDCPEAFPEGREFDDAVVCGDEEAPDEMRDELESRGWVDPALTCEDDPELGIVYVSDDPECAFEDIRCPEGDEPFRDACGCGCRYTGCEDGDVETLECEECVCGEGEWSCTPTACGLDACLEACGAGCPAPEFQICGEDGELYCNECVMACYDVDPAEDPSACAPPPDCEEGDTRMDDCNRCVCEAGAWACTEMDCGVEACLEECGVGCPAPEFQICGEDGERYCNECVMGCFGVAPADDPSLCAPGVIECVPPPDATPIPWERFDMPAGCAQPWDSGVAESEDEFLLLYDCDSDSAFGIDWSAFRAVHAVFRENPGASIDNVYERSDTEVLVYLVAPPYCGGPAPPNMHFDLLIPAGELDVRVGSCVEGECEEFFP